MIALVGLLGILAGDQIVPLGEQMLSGHAFHSAWQQSDCTLHIFGSFPGQNVGDVIAAGRLKSSDKGS